MPKATIIFVTRNRYKFRIAEWALKKSSLKIKIVQRKLDVPEIQSDSVEAVAKFSAQWASKILKKPVAVSDAGCYIEALGGFPGPFIKYINQWFSAKDLLRLMDGKKNRRVLWKDCLAYCKPAQRPVSFVSYFEGAIAERIGKNQYRKKYGWIDALFIPQGFAKPLSEFPTRNYFEFWGNSENFNSWHKLLKYLESRKPEK